MMLMLTIIKKIMIIIITTLMMILIIILIIVIMIIIITTMIIIITTMIITIIIIRTITIVMKRQINNDNIHEFKNINNDDKINDYNERHNNMNQSKNSRLQGADGLCSTAKCCRHRQNCSAAEI